MLDYQITLETVWYAFAECLCIFIKQIQLCSNLSWRYAIGNTTYKRAAYSMELLCSWSKEATRGERTQWRNRFYSCHIIVCRFQHIGVRSVGVSCAYLPSTGHVASQWSRGTHSTSAIKWCHIGVHATSAWRLVAVLQQSGGEALGNFHP